MTSTRPGIGYLIKQVQGRLHTALAGALAEHDLTVAQYAALVAIAEQPGLSNADLARRAFVTPQTTHRLVAELEGMGLVARTPHPANARVLQAELTSAGARRLERATTVAEAVETSMLHGMMQAELRGFKAALARCDENLSEHHA